MRNRLSNLQGGEDYLKRNLERICGELAKDCEIEKRHFENMSHFEYYRAMCQDLEIFKSSMERA